MSNKVFRQVIRWSHILIGALMITYIYSATLRENAIFAGLVQFVVVPAVIVSGALLWQQPRIAKLIRALRGADRKEVNDVG